MIVVAAGIVQRDGKIMVCQRKAGKANGLKWEFPGGKLEPGESPEAALERELREELGIQTRTGRIYDAKHRVESGRELLILFYFSEILSGEPQPIDRAATYRCVLNRNASQTASSHHGCAAVAA